MRNLLVCLMIYTFTCIPVLAETASHIPSQSPQNIQNDDLKWRIGGKIHFEEDGGTDYIGINEINKSVRAIIKKYVTINEDICNDNAKILLKRDGNEIQMTHFVEKSRPGMGEEMHATLLYTQARGFCDSETLKQICENLFEKCDVPPSILELSEKYSSIINPAWKFRIEEVVLTKSTTGSSFIMAKLLFDDHERIYYLNRPISAGLHMTLVNLDHSILTSDEISDLMINEINGILKNKMIKIAKKNGIADLEFGISGSSWRIRAGERIP